MNQAAVQNELLISLVHGQPVLWDQMLAAYKNLDARTAAWVAVAIGLGLAGTQGEYHTDVCRKMVPYTTRCDIGEEANETHISEQLLFQKTFTRARTKLTRQDTGVVVFELVWYVCVYIM